MTFDQIYLALRKRILRLLRGRYFVVSRRGARYLVDIKNYIDRHIEAYGGYENDRLDRFLDEMAKFNCAVFVDIGANLGVYTVAVATRFPKIDIVAFEPDRINFAQLHANLFLNTIADRVNVHSVALSNKAGITHFHRHGDENRGRSAIRPDGEIPIQTMILDSLLVVSGQRVALKVDVEGHEAEVLMGARSLLANNKCLLQVECFDVSRIKPLLTELGYAVKWQIGDDYVFESERN